MNILNLKVSIITVSFNSENTIKDTIESVLNQTYRNIEYIIIDGGSKDGTVAIIKDYEEEFSKRGIAYIWISEKDKGIYDAMNKGIEKSNGDLIGIINSDDWYENNSIARVVERYNIEKFDMIYGDIRIIKREKSFVKKAKLSPVVTSRYWNHPTTFVKKDLYQKIRFQCKYIYDDLDFMLRVRKNKYKVIVLNEVLANFRLGGISNKKNFFQLLKDIGIRNKIYSENGYSRLYFIDNALIEFYKYFSSLPNEKRIRFRRNNVTN